MQIKEPEKILKDIRTIRKDLEKNEINLPPSLAGIYGEVLVYQEMKKHFEPKGYKVEFSSGQTRADIQLVKDRKVINVEVKTSRLKEEWFGVGYGFAINIKPCKTHTSAFYNHSNRGKLPGDFCYFDYIVLVTLSKDLEQFKFYIFPKAFLIKNELHIRNRSARFNRGTHRMIFAEKPLPTSEITPFDKKLMKNRNKYASAWKMIK
jgi:hypothetical protein